MRNPLPRIGVCWRRILAGTALLLGLFAVSVGHSSVAWADDNAPSSASVDEQGGAGDGEAASDSPDSDAIATDHAASDHHDDHDDHASNAGHDSEGHEEHADEGPGLLSANPGAAIWNLLIFLTVLTILGVFVWPQILSGLQAREAKIHSDLHAAEEANRQAQASLADYQKQLSEAQDQVRQMLADARRDAEGVGLKIVEEAKADAQRQRERALADIEAAKNVALGELAGQTSAMAIALARQVVGRELKPADHADLIQKSLEQLPSRN